MIRKYKYVNDLGLNKEFWYVPDESSDTGYSCFMITETDEFFPFNPMTEKEIEEFLNHYGVDINDYEEE